MVGVQGALFILNAHLIDGTGRPAQPEAGIRIEGDRIAAVGSASELGPIGPADRVLDAAGRTLMPGLIESHFHFCFNDSASIPQADPRVPPYYVAICAARNAETALASGYTAVRSGGSMFNVDVAVKLAVERGLIRGPRIKPSGQEITGTAGVIDPNPSWAGDNRKGMTIVVDGPIEARRAARRLIRDGAEVIKAYPTGDPGSDRIDHTRVCMTEDEVRAIADEVHLHRGAMFAVHATSDEGVKMCVRAGVDSIEHGFMASDEAIDMMAQRDVFLVPALGYLQRSLEATNKPGVTARSTERVKRSLEHGADVARKALRAGVRVALGGDYGFFWIRHGTYARELETFVDYVGWTPMQAIVAATKTGGQILGMESEVGTLEVGKFADLLLVDGNPLADIRVLQDKARLNLIVKGGEIVGGSLQPQALAREHVAV